MADELKDLTIGFIGAGAMAEAMMRGLAGTGARLMAADPDTDRRRVAERECGAVACAENLHLVEEADLIVLAVKPQNAFQVLREIGLAMRPGQILLSVVAGLRLGRMADLVTPGVRLVRAMPNTPALIGAGITGVSFAEDDPELERMVSAVLEAVGGVVAVPEKLLDAVTGLSGSGPAYVALFIEALIEGGVKAGLPRQIAHELAVRTVQGTAQLIGRGESPAAVRERVTSPGGTTAYGLYALERAGLRAAAIEAVTAAAERSAELGNAQG